MNVTVQHQDLARESDCAAGWKRHFMKPEGRVGKLFGTLMARKNALQTLTGVELFDVQTADHVLEIGFGPGVGIEALSAKAADGQVSGVDWSEAMVALASKRNWPAIADGRVELRQGSAVRLPYPDAQFDKVFEANSFHIWPDRNAALREIHRVLKPGGQLMLCLRMKHPTRTKLVAPGHKREDIPAIEAALLQAGFTIAGIDTHELARTITYLKASKVQ